MKQVASSIYETKVASWDDIKVVYERDKQQTLRCCPKLTQKHLNLNGFQKMKVKLATQVMSQTVASTLSTYVALGALPPSAIGTAELISNFDNIFDCLNSPSLNSPKIYKRAVTKDSPHHKFFTDMLKFIASIKVVDKQRGEDVKNKLRCLRGLTMTLNGLQELWKDLHRHHSLDFLMTRRLNQDPLENFFGLIRQLGENCDNPSPIQFTRAFRKLFVDNFLAPLSTGNCAEDFDTYLIASRPSQSDLSAANDQRGPPQIHAVKDTDYKTNDIEQNLVSMNALTYVSGYLLRKCLIQHSCPICHQNYVTKDVNDSSQLLCMFKTFEGIGSADGLTIPKETFVKHVSSMESTFVNVLNSCIERKNIGSYLCSQMPKLHGSVQWPNFPVI